MFEPRVVFENLVLGLAGGKEVQNQGNPDAVSSNAGFPEADVRIYGDSLEEGIAVHRVTVPFHRVIDTFNPSVQNFWSSV